MRVFILFGILSVTLVSCAHYSRNWQGSDTPGLTHASFNYFNGKTKQTIALTKGQLLFTEYRVTATSGSLSLSVKQGSKVLWQKRFQAQSDTASFYITAPETGDYTVFIEGDHATGSYYVHYSPQDPKKVQVKTNRNIELLGLIFQLDNGGDILARKDTVMIEGKLATWQQWYAMMIRNYLQYKQFDTCHAMSLYKHMQAEGYFNDFFVDFLLQVDEVPQAKINSTTERATIKAFSPKGDTTEALQKATAFLETLNIFYKTVDFNTYFIRNKQYYDITKASVQNNLPGEYFLPVMEHYYRKQFSNYCLVPSMNLLTSTGFGKTNRNTGTIYNTFGPFSFQCFDSLHPDMAFAYPEKIKILSTHEFGHSFVNPSVDKLPATLIDATEYLFEPVRKEMTAHSTPSWTICLYEHFVKAGEVIIAEKLGDTTRAQLFMQDAVKAGFIYLPFIVKELKQWDKNYSTDASFDSAVFNTLKSLDSACKTAPTQVPPAYTSTK